jgi:hypothetical protein
MLVFCGTTYYHALTADTQFRQDLVSFSPVLSPVLWIRIRMDVAL